MTAEEKKRQRAYLAKDPGAYGGELYKTRRGRARPRPLSQQHSMHLVLRSTKAVGRQSFRQHEPRVVALLKKFSAKHRVHIYSQAIQSNHLHIHVHIRHGRHTYLRFIRALTASLAMLATGASRWNPLPEKFWDARPFTRLVRGTKAFQRVQRYVRTNHYESFGCSRSTARFYAAWEAGEKVDWG